MGGTTYGVAKSVTLHAVRVLNCSGSGSTSGVIAGVDWVTANRVRPAVANMSLGGGASSALDTAVVNSTNAGATYAVAAGNSSANACNSSPARVAAALTVGATTSSDARASYSNYGSCLDVFAPGSGITSAWYTSNTATSTISGTSMAAPHVAGTAALYLQTAPWSFSWDTLTATNGGHTLTAKAYDPSGNVGTSAGVTVTVSNATAGELLVNGGFEGSASPWVLSGNAYWSTGGYPHGGSGYSILGAYNNASGAEHQTVTIPSSAAGTLTFWLNVTSSETTTTTVYDRLYVEVKSTTGALLGTLGTYSNLNKGTIGAYAQRSLSLAAWRGQTVRVQFRATTDSVYVTSFRVDDVSVR